MLGFKAPTKSESLLPHRYKNLDFSNLSDAELNYPDNLMGKASYPNGAEPDGGQPYEGDGDRFDKRYKIARAMSEG